VNLRKDHSHIFHLPLHYTHVKDLETVPGRWSV